MKELHFTDGSSLKYMDLSDILNDDMIMNASEENSYKITIPEVGDELGDFFWGKGELVLAGQNNETSFVPDDTPDPVSVPSVQTTIDAGKSGILTVASIKTDNYRYFYLHTATTWNNEKEDMYDDRNYKRVFPPFKNSSAEVRDSNGMYTYLVRFRANRKDFVGIVQSDYGFGILSSRFPLEPKTYNIKLNTNYKRPPLDGTWVNFNSTVWEDYYFLRRAPWGTVGLDTGTRFIKGFMGISYRGDTVYSNDRYVRLLQLEGAIENSSSSITPPAKKGGPMIGAIDSGMVGIYATPATTENKMQDLAKKLWTKELVSSLKQSLFDTQSAILNMSLFPVNLATAQTTSGEPVLTAEEVPVVLNGVLVGLTELDAVKMNKVQAQFIRVEWAAAAVGGKYHSYLDHNPYTTASLYLPYSGSYEINIDDFVNHYMKIFMLIDIFTGDIKYEIYRMLEKDDPLEKGRLLYNFVGNISYNIPISSANYAEMFTSFISTAAKLV